MFHTFSYIVTGVIFICALFLTIFNRDGTVSGQLLWQILITSFLCVLGNLIYPQRKIPEWKLILLRLLHYVYINAVVFGCAKVFWWFDIRDWEKTGFMLIGIAVVFVLVSWAVWHKGKKISVLLNESLKKYQNKMPE
ncbi:MAG: DUF3021 family protein [Blautia sp.]|nr:DUF3021 family protein [Blautia sp.]